MHQSVSRLLPVVALAVSALSIPSFAGPADSAWIQLFNPKDTSLATNWDIKIRYSALNVDTRGTFKRAIVGSDTVLDVSYAGYTSFNNPGETHGNIGYKIRPFNYYVVRAEHQFYGSQVANGPSWAVQNNGIMHHAQSIASFGLDQDFPISLEAQLQGPSATADNNSSMNLCTPGTAFYNTLTGGTINTAHCTSVLTLNRAQAGAPNWAWAKVEAYSDSVIKYYFKDTLVFTFYRPVEYPGNVVSNTQTITQGKAVKGGYIILQGESAPTRFRRVELLNLEGCMFPTTDANYKSYLIKHDSTACAGSTGIRGTSPQEARYAAPLTFVGNSIKVGGVDKVKLELYDMSGTRIGRVSAQAPFQWSPSVKTSGVHVIRAITPKGTYTEKATLF